MDHVIGMILEMVAAAILVMFLIAYLSGGFAGNGVGVWSGMVYSDEEGNDTAEAGADAPGTMVDDTEALTGTILAAQCPDVFGRQGQVDVNRIYRMAELFTDGTEEDYFLEVEEIYLGEVRVLARGDIAVLSESETPAGALYDTGNGEIMFTRTGNYRVLLRVGTAYGWKPCKETWVTIPVVSDFTLNRMEEACSLKTMQFMHGLAARGGV